MLTHKDGHHALYWVLNGLETVHATLKQVFIFLEWYLLLK